MGFASCGSDDNDDAGGAGEGGGNGVEYAYNTFDEPFLGFGSSALQIKEACAKKTLIGENGSVLMYQGNKKAEYEAYYLENLRLATSMMFCNVDLVEADEIVGFLNERYAYMGGIDSDKDGGEDEWLYYDESRSLAVMLTVAELNEDVCWAVSYVHYEMSEAKKKVKAIKTVAMPANVTKVTTGQHIDAINAVINK